MLLIEAKEIAERILNEGFYAYHNSSYDFNTADPEHRGTGTFGPGMYFFLYNSSDVNNPHLYGNKLYKCYINGNLKKDFIDFQLDKLSDVIGSNISSIDDLKRLKLLKSRSITNNLRSLNENWKSFLKQAKELYESSAANHESYYITFIQGLYKNDFNTIARYLNSESIVGSISTFNQFEEYCPNNIRLKFKKKYSKIISFLDNQDINSGFEYNRGKSLGDITKDLLFNFIKDYYYVILIGFYYYYIKKFNSEPLSQILGPDDFKELFGEYKKGLYYKEDKQKHRREEIIVWFNKDIQIVDVMQKPQRDKDGNLSQPSLIRKNKYKLDKKDSNRLKTTKTGWSGIYDFSK